MLLSAGYKQVKLLVINGFSAGLPKICGAWAHEELKTHSSMLDGGFHGNTISLSRSFLPI